MVVKVHPDVWQTILPLQQVWERVILISECRMGLLDFWQPSPVWAILASQKWEMPCPAGNCFTNAAWWRNCPPGLAIFHLPLDDVGGGVYHLDAPSKCTMNYSLWPSTQSLPYNYFSLGHHCPSLHTPSRAPALLFLFTQITWKVFLKLFNNISLWFLSSNCFLAISPRLSPYDHSECKNQGWLTTIVLRECCNVIN